MNNQNIDINQANYTSFKHLVQSRYNYSQFQYNEMISAMPELETDWKKYLNNIELLHFFGVNLVEACKAPKILKQENITDVRIICASGMLAGVELNANYFNSHFFFEDTAHNINAIKLGYLPKNSNILLETKKAAKIANMSYEEFLFKCAVPDPRKDIIMEFNKTFPDLGAKINKWLNHHKTKKKVQKASLEIQKQVSTLLPNLTSSRPSNKLSLRNNSNLENVVYSTDPEVLIKKYQSSTETTNSNINAQSSTNLNVENNVSFNQVNTSEVKTPLFKKVKQEIEPEQNFEKLSNEDLNDNDIWQDFDPDLTNKYDNMFTNDGIDDDFINKVTQEPSLALKNDANKYAEKYSVSPNHIIKKQEFCEKHFGFTSEEFFAKLEASDNLLKADEETFKNSIELLSKVVGLQDNQIKVFAKLFNHFPFVNIPHLMAKIKHINDVGIPNQVIFNNLQMLKINTNRLILRAKLAYITSYPLDLFAKYGFKNSENFLYARIRAIEEGIIHPKSKIFIAESIFNKETNHSTFDLAESFPLNEDAIIDIETTYNKLQKINKPWTISYVNRAYNEINNGKSVIDNVKSEVLTPKGDIQPTKSELEEEAIKKVKAKKQTYVENAQEPTVQSTYNILKLFDCTPTELEKLLNKFPFITSIKTEQINELKEVLINNYDISEKEFSKSLRSNPILATKTKEDLESFNNFCREHLFMTNSQIKEALIKHEEIITKKPEAILTNSKLLAKELSVPLNEIAESLIKNPTVINQNPERLERRIKSLKNLGFTNNEISNGLKALTVNEEVIKIRYMLNKINNRSNKEFLYKNCLTNESKVYARTMFNLMYQKELDVYAIESKYCESMNKTMNNTSIPETLSKNPSETLIQLYPFGITQKKQIEQTYNLKNSSNQLTLSQDELEFGIED